MSPWVHLVELYGWSGKHDECTIWFAIKAHWCERHIWQLTVALVYERWNLISHEIDKIRSNFLWHFHGFWPTNIIRFRRKWMLHNQFESTRCDCLLNFFSFCVFDNLLMVEFNGTILVPFYWILELLLKMVNKLCSPCQLSLNSDSMNCYTQSTEFN